MRDDEDEVIVMDKMSNGGGEVEGGFTEKIIGDVKDDAVNTVNNEGWNGGDKAKGEKEVTGLFPKMLYSLINNESDDIITWACHDKAFKVVDVKGLELVLKKYFRHQVRVGAKRRQHIAGNISRPL